MVPLILGFPARYLLSEDSLLATIAGGGPGGLEVLVKTSVEVDVQGVYCLHVVS